MFSKQDFCVCCLWPDEALMAEKFKGSRCWTLVLWFFHHTDTNISCQLEIMQNNSFWMTGINTFQTSAWRIKTGDDDNLKDRGARTAKQLACMCRPEKKGACFVILVATSAVHYRIMCLFLPSFWHCISDRSCPPVPPLQLSGKWFVNVFWDISFFKPWIQLSFQMFFIKFDISWLKCLFNSKDQCFNFSNKGLLNLDCGCWECFSI